MILQLRSDLQSYALQVWEARIYSVFVTADIALFVVPSDNF